MASVKVSVLMPAYNAEEYLLASINSVLDQTFDDFELLIIDDASTDQTANILNSIKDSRLRVLRNDSNLGIVRSLNRGLSEARGLYIARTDADDVCFPTRFAQQVAFLDSHLDVVLVGTGMVDLEGGRLSPSRRQPETDPAVLRWLLQISNPVGHPSMMFRTEAARSLDVYLRQERQYAEDFDFSHRMLHQGGVAVLPQTLMVYRLHAQNISRIRRQDMISRTAAVLCESYENLLGRPASNEAIAVTNHLFAGTPIPDNASLHNLGLTLDVLLDAFLERYRLSAIQRHRCESHTSKAWWRCVENSIRSGFVLSAVTQSSSFKRASLERPDFLRLGSTVLRGAMPNKALIRQILDSRRQASRLNGASPGTYLVNQSSLTVVPAAPDGVPSLTVVVDTEAEFDWTKPFNRSMTAVNAMAAQEEAQSIFDFYGLRPIYLVDYAVSTQPKGYEPLRRILARRGCAIGAHLHPWITPPLEEPLNNENSFAGNLPLRLEEAKLRVLVEAIEGAFGIRPLFFKAGRYGLGPNTLHILKQLGFEVDFSIMPLADYRGPGGIGGGTDFRHAGIEACRTTEDGVLCVPMTRAQVGMLAPLPPWMHSAVSSPLGQKLRLPGLLSRLNLANTITLTPEGVTAEEQVTLMQHLVNLGHRRFVLHYHSPSLVPGNTPYVRTSEDLVEFKERLAKVCRFFFEEIGGLPGHPGDLLLPSSRDLLWPKS